VQPAKKYNRSQNRLSGEWLDRYQTKERIGQQLRDYYRASTPEQLPPRLVALIKMLDEKHALSAEQVQIIRDIEN
jgi:hypothetical protein